MASERPHPAQEHLRAELRRALDVGWVDVHKVRRDLEAHPDRRGREVLEPRALLVQDCERRIERTGHLSRHLSETIKPEARAHRRLIVRSTRGAHLASPSNEWLHGPEHRAKRVTADSLRF